MLVIRVGETNRCLIEGAISQSLGMGDCAGHPPAGPFLKHTSKEQIANFCSVALPLRSRRPSRKKGFNHILLLPAGPSNARRPLHGNG